MKTKYSSDELKEFELLLMQKLERNNKQIQSMKDQLAELSENTKDENRDDSSSHQTQISTLTTSVSRLEKHGITIENALLRIKNNIYGVCAETGKLISAERLRAVPTTTLSIEGKSIREKSK